MAEDDLQGQPSLSEWWACLYLNESLAVYQASALTSLITDAVIGVVVALATGERDLAQRAPVAFRS